MQKILFVIVFVLGFTAQAFSQNKNVELYKAISNNSLERVRTLLQDSTDVNFKMSEGVFAMTMLSTAINVSRNIKMVELLLQHKADVNEKDAFNTTPLMYAASMGDQEMVKLLLQYGADASAGDGQGNTVLSAAKEGGNKSVIALIKQKLQDKK
jgi:ankyrin repeat protein